MATFSADACPNVPLAAAANQLVVAMIEGRYRMVVDPRAVVVSPSLRAVGAVPAFAASGRYKVLPRRPNHRAGEQVSLSTSWVVVWPCIASGAVLDGSNFDIRMWIQMCGSDAPRHVQGRSDAETVTPIVKIMVRSSGACSRDARVW